MNTDSNSILRPEQMQAGGPLGRALRFWGFLFASLVTVVALAWAIENWRGARAWSVVKRDLAARGEPLSFNQLVPPLPPDDQNFAATPLLRPLLNYSSGGSILWADPEARARISAISLPPTHEPRSRHGSRHRSPREEVSRWNGPIDLMPYALGIRLRPRACPPDLDPALAERYGYLPPGVKWTKPTNDLEIAASITDPAQEVLDYLRRFDPELQEISAAVGRPYSQFPLHWAEGYRMLLPHLAPLKQFTILFSTRSAARLQKLDPAGAAQDVITCLKLAHALESEPVLISQLVSCAEHRLAVKALAQGLSSHQWTADQLTAFQTELARFKFQTQASNAIRGERAGQNEFLDQFSRMGRAALDAISPGDASDGPLLLLLPWVPGWVRQNQARLIRYDDLVLRQVTDPRWPANIGAALDPQAPRIAAGLTDDNPYTVLARLLAPDLSKAQVKTARAQTDNQLAIVACSLERFRLEHGDYPKALSELKPSELSGSYQDPMSGLPLHYERGPDDGVQKPAEFHLWSVGLNGQDDGGVMWDQDNDAHGDWVWPQGGAPSPARF